jgi:hypothetical protein
MSFSRATILEALTIFEDWTVNNFERYLIKFNLEKIAPSSLGSKPTRINALISHFIANPDLLGPSGSNIVYETIEHILSKSSWGGYAAPTPSKRYTALAYALKLDGYELTDSGHILTIVPPSAPLATKQTEVEILVKKFGFATAEGHLNQALSAHARGQWAAANSQLRSFTESLFDAFADKLLPHPLPATSELRRLGLAKINPPFIDPTFNEWDFKSNKGFIQGFWNRLHPGGSHPGLSDEDDCTFRLQLVFLVAHRFLKRFENYP